MGVALGEAERGSARNIVSTSVFSRSTGRANCKPLWRALASPQIAIANDAVEALISGLEPGQIHSLKVTALGANGDILWDSPLIVLGPPPVPSWRTRNWAIIFGGALLVLLVLRWRANRPSP